MSFNKNSHYLLLAFISPALAMFVAARKEDERFIVIAGTLFMGLLGSVFVYVQGNDGHTHLMSVYEYYLEMSFIEFVKGLGSLLIFQPIKASNDVYKHVISYLSGGIFRVPELIHLFGGLLLGYFFTKSVLLVLEDKPNQKMGILLGSFIALFLISRSVSALNSLRMWTAMWVFFYGSFAYVKSGKTKYLWIVLLSVFIHFSYLIYVLPLGLVFFLEKQRLVIVAVFVGSFFVNVGFEQIATIVEITGLYQDKAKYTVLDGDTLERRAGERSAETSNANFYKSLGPTVYKSFSTVLLAFTLLIIYIKGTGKKYLDFLIAGGLMILALSNLASSSSPAVEGRGYTIASLFLVAAAIEVLFLKDYLLVPGYKSRLIKLSFSIFLISSIPYILFNISYSLNTISYFSVIMPLGSWLLGEGDLSIRDFIITLF